MSPPDDDPVTVTSLVESYRRWSNAYLERTLIDFKAAEAYNRKRRDAIETVLAERQPPATAERDA